MSATGKTFEDLEERLEELYAKVDCLIADNEDSAPRTLRSRTSAGKRSSRSGSQSSSVLKAKLVAKEELAKLKLKH